MRLSDYQQPMYFNSLELFTLWINWLTETLKNWQFVGISANSMTTAEYERAKQLDQAVETHAKAFPHMPTWMLRSLIIDLDTPENLPAEIAEKLNELA